MKNFIHHFVKTIGFSDGGIASFFYAFYLWRYKKLSYEEEMIIKSEYKKRYINIQIFSYCMYFVILMSLFLIIELTDWKRGVVYIVHLLLFLGVFGYKIYKQI